MIGLDNTLTIQGTCLIEHNVGAAEYAAIHVGKGGDAAEHLDGVAAAVDGLSASGEPEILYYDGQPYVEMIVTLPEDYEVIGDSVGTFATEEYRSYPKRIKCFATLGVLEGYAPNVTTTLGNYPFSDANNPLLQKVVAPKCTKLNEGYWCYKCTALTYVQLGSVGYPVELMAGSSVSGFSGCTNANLVIEIYVDAATLEDIPTDVSQYAPWGATKATIVYRNSTTGEVLSE